MGRVFRQSDLMKVAMELLRDGYTVVFTGSGIEARPKAEPEKTDSYDTVRLGK